MLYCTFCADRNNWPKNENKRHGIGRCEFCRRSSVLNFAPNAVLPEAPPLNAIEKLGIDKRSEQ